ncbi:MAG TPA: hypothetical protein DCK76_08925 [Desulfotomaculum sp.]|nr:MAG: Copper amine oxidase domain protein [Desulfotomaculum sp. 46_80]HAG11484.1 hypothetical protein [Desulfotomaculum sp.]HBY04709.1 hypothetical protein [Desulfotomaculum sp.]
MYRLKIFLVFAAVMVFFQSVFFPAPGMARQIHVNVNGQILNSSDILIENGHTLVSCRVFSEQLGAEVKWNAVTRTVTITRKQDIIRLTPGSATAFKNGAKINLDVSAIIIGGRLYVPLKALAESLGAKVVWDEARSTVLVDNGYCPVCVSLKK